MFFKNLFASAAILALIGGCILTTGQVTFVEDINNGGSSSEAVNFRWLDLNNNSDYRDNVDKIESIDNVSIVAWIKNNGASPVVAEVWVDADSNYAYSNPDTVRAHATRIMVTPPVPPGDSILVDWSDSFQHMENIAYLEDLIRNVGVFAVYVLGSTVPFDIWVNGQIAITMTVGA